MAHDGNADVDVTSYAHGSPRAPATEGGQSVSAENRLTAEQLADLTPGDDVTIESGLEFNRRRYTTGTVARITGRHVVVSCGRYVESYGLLDGIREGGAGRAEIVDHGPRADDEAQRRARQIDLLYREWCRDRADFDRLRQLHAAISECLDEDGTASPQVATSADVS